jgi:hypothetical protein
MNYTAIEMPSPKGSYFKITTSRCGFVFLNMYSWTQQYKPTTFCGFNTVENNNCYYLSVSEEKSIANLTTLIKNAIEDDEETFTIEIIKTEEEFTKCTHGKSCSVLISGSKTSAEQARDLVKELDKVRGNSVGVGELTFNAQTKNYKTIKTMDAVVPCTTSDDIEQRRQNMRAPKYTLKSFDIEIPFNNTNGIYRIPYYFQIIMTGISVSYGDFSFDINGTERGSSTNGHLNLEIIPGDKNNKWNKMTQELAWGTHNEFLDKLIAVPDSSHPFFSNKWLNCTRIEWPIIRNLSPNNTITLHCVGVVLEDEKDKMGWNWFCWPIIQT